MGEPKLIKLREWVKLNKELSKNIFFLVPIASAWECISIFEPNFTCNPTLVGK